MQKDLPAYLRLCHALKFSSRRILRLLDHFDHDAERALRASPATLRACGIDERAAGRMRQRRLPGVELDLEWAEASGHRLLAYHDPAYPELLRQIPDSPALLYVSGHVECLQTPQIAIVGSRNCTPGGAQNAHDFALQSAAAGLTITSGLALGIDSAAHRGALDAGGATIAVTGTGLDRVYPRRNRGLAEQIVERGALVTEFATGTDARPANFPQRNRIISGLAIATLVVEATVRSGSLITARLAAEQGREVFAIPGSIHNPQAQGCHRLIRDGATLTENAADIGAELGSLFDYASHRQASRKEPAPVLDAQQRALLESIGYDPVHCDLLVQRSGLTMDKLSSMLVTLELNDLIQSAPGGCYVRI